MSTTPHTLVLKATAAVTQFIEEALDDGRESVEFAELEAIADKVRIHVSTVVKITKSFGMRVEERPVHKEVRGFKSNNHDRWNGKGSCASHGGSGWEQINGFGGQKG